MSDGQQPEKQYKPGWQLLYEAARAITSLSDQELVGADLASLRKTLYCQIWARLDEIVPQDHLADVATEVAKAEVCCASFPQFSPWGTQFVLERLGREKAEELLFGLGDQWRVAELNMACSCGNPECPAKKNAPAVRIVESSLAEAICRANELSAEGDLAGGMATINVALLNGPFGRQIMASAMDAADQAMGLDAIMGNPIMVGSGENLEDALRRAFPGHMVVRVGGPRADLLASMLDHRREERPTHYDSEFGRVDSSKPSCNCGACPACMMRAADSATEDAPAPPAEDPFGDQ